VAFSGPPARNLAGRGPAKVASPSSGKRRSALGIPKGLALAPFGAYVSVFLVLPATAVVIAAFESPTGKPTLENLRLAFRGTYRQGFITSIELASLASVMPAIAGALVAYAIHVGRPESALRRAVVTASGVLANFGGVQLAFLFIASFGSTGLATQWLGDLGINLASLGFNLYSFAGVLLVYMYFQIPLMVLVMLPSLQALRSEWREAASNLGASSLQYWRHVAAPALAPAFLGSCLLLFGFGFSAYATADALTSGSLALSSIQIGSFLNGNVLASQQNVGKAIAFGMLVVVAAVMAVYLVLQKRASRWLR
jgi:putative spermidine/putrescine transport system permease protein